MAVPVRTVRLRVCAVVGREGVEFEKDVRMPRVPFVGQVVPEGRLGDSETLFVGEVEHSAVFQCWLARVEDDVADDVAGVEELAEAYARAGWRLARRASLHVCPPQNRRRGRAAS